MNQATFLISKKLIAKYPHLKYLSGMELRDKLHYLLKDPLLWRKMKELRSGKYTKQYQPQKLQLKRVYFYPFPEDWCLLSILSNGSGFSRCYIFIHLLRYDLKDLQLNNDVTPTYPVEIMWPQNISCIVRLDKRMRIFRRWQKTLPEHPETPENPPIHI